MGRTAIYSKLVLPDSLLEDGMLLLEDDKIQYVGPVINFDGIHTVIHHDGYVWPGLIDIHVHGAGGADVMDANPSALQTIADTVIKYGVTGFLATTLTASRANIESALQCIADTLPELNNTSRILGVHLEGPWICPLFKGAQNPEFIVTPQVEDVDWVWNSSGGALRLVTLAPDMENVLNVMQKLKERDVIVSIGHSDASFEQVEVAMKYGLTHVTHCYNAMRRFHHWEPGVVGAALYLDELSVELIADGIHVHPKAAALLTKVKPRDQLILITDGNCAVGMPEGEYEIGGLKISVSKGRATLEDGTLAGSVLTMDQAVRNMVQFAKVPLYEAVRMASLAPAKKIGCSEHYGSLEVGKKADLVFTDSNCLVKSVWVNGKSVVELEKSK